MSVVSRLILVFAAVSSIAGIVYAAGFATPPVAQAQGATAASIVPAIGTMLVVAAGSVGLFVSKMLPRRKG